VNSTEQKSFVNLMSKNSISGERSANVWRVFCSCRFACVSIETIRPGERLVGVGAKKGEKQAWENRYLERKEGKTRGGRLGKGEGDN
jgi:hypothetical protein